jgi:hypothetical protein
MNLYTDKILDIFKNAKIYPNTYNTSSKTIIVYDDSFLKMYAGSQIIHYANKKYYESNYSSIQEGVADSVRIINEIDNNIIINHKFKDNYYLEINTRRIETEYKLHEKKLISEFDSIEDYIVYFRDNIKRRNRKYGALRFNDYHSGNIMIDKDLNWTNVDVDGIICYGMHSIPEFSPHFLNYGNVGDLINYDQQYILDIWENK